ncbi:hypothetical protein BSL78_13081 [Apostichopus japonicus]|uniref:Uncharacterized protein n=1 Tax=Stichopus japonicus TaxID=307972 RepID=A0A2G8KPY1_STIJA|nr:hypothetical protein BSL78_13081 [Apostichopus japonicus]
METFPLKITPTTDAGTYHLSLADADFPYTLYSHHTYHLFTVYQPPTPLVCQGPSSSPSGSYHVAISCSITNGFPPINLEMIEPEGCDFQKHYTDDNGIQELSVDITSCNENSTVGCIATQETLAFLSTPQYSDRCVFNISKSSPVSGKCILVIRRHTPPDNPPGRVPTQVIPTLDSSHQRKLHLDNIPHRLPTGQLPPDDYPPGQFPPGNPSDNFPDTIGPLMIANREQPIVTIL